MKVLKILSYAYCTKAFKEVLAFSKILGPKYYLGILKSYHVELSTFIEETGIQ